KCPAKPIRSPPVRSSAPWGDPSPKQPYVGEARATPKAYRPPIRGEGPYAPDPNKKPKRKKRKEKTKTSAKRTRADEDRKISLPFSPPLPQNSSETLSHCNSMTISVCLAF